MIKQSLLSFALLLHMTAICSAEAPISTGDSYLQALRHFNPATRLNDYTTTPRETELAPSEESDALKANAATALTQNQAAHEVYTEAKTRTKAIPNPNSAEMQYAEQLIESSEDVKAGGCYAQPPLCEAKTTQEICEEHLQQENLHCQDTLHVRLNTHTQRVQRWIPDAGTFDGILILDVTHCGSNDPQCTADNLITLYPGSQSLQIQLTYRGQVLKQRQLNGGLVWFGWPALISDYVDITVTEQVLEDEWDNHACTALRHKATQGQCSLTASNACLEPNTTKVIDGIPVTRTCWGMSMDYQCSTLTDSTCTALINQGCSQETSLCTAQVNNACTTYTQGFACTTTTCVPQPDVCTGVIPCADGSCDQTVNEESHDMGEGVSKLGALAGAANDVATKQIDESTPSIFIGGSMTCKKHVLGVRDCCKDSGWGDWVKHCPPEMQQLQAAKRDNRAVYLGSYKEDKLSSRHHVYCVFPSTLAGIVQIQGRGQQLGISFGEPKNPQCRGLSPLEFERLNFDKLDLSPIEKELTARLNVPSGSEATNQAHIERLHDQGRAYDLF